MQIPDVFALLILFLGLQLVLMLFRAQARQWQYQSYKPYLWDAQRKLGVLHPRLLKLEKAVTDKVRLYFFWFQVERLKREAVPGAFVELGVYKGETAQWLQIMDPQRPLHLLDTFAGFVAEDLAQEKVLSKTHIPGFFADTSLEAVQKRLAPSSDLHFHVGAFPETAQSLPEQSYALVHLDADLYWPTLKALEYFYPRLSPGGVLIVHDYNHVWEGVRRAVDEFCPTVPETLLEWPDWQGSAILVRDRQTDPQPSLD